MKDTSEFPLSPQEFNVCIRSAACKLRTIFNVNFRNEKSSKMEAVERLRGISACSILKGDLPPLSIGFATWSVLGGLLRCSSQCSKYLFPWPASH